MDSSVTSVECHQNFFQICAAQHIDLLAYIGKKPYLCKWETKTTMIHKQDIISKIRELATRNISYGRLYNELVRNEEKLSELQNQEFNDFNELLKYINVA